MFGLWYLSLAIDEIRKHFGWSSIFDIFKGNKAAAGTKAIDDKHTNKNVTKPEPQPAKKPEVPKVPEKVPEFKPQPPPKPVVEPPKPVVELPKPVVQPPKPAVEPVKPIEKPKTPEFKPTPPKLPEFKPEPPRIPEMKPETPKLPELPKTPETPKAPLSPFAADFKPSSPSPSSFANNGFSQTNKDSFNGRTQNLFNNPRAFENGSGGGSFGAAGDDFSSNAKKAASNIKDATSSFLEGEGQGSNFKPQQDLFEKRNKSDTMVDAAVLKKLEDGFAKLQASDSKSLLKKYLTKEIFDNLKNKKTPTFGSTLLDCVQSGFENHDSGFGIYAPDAEAYSVFAELFDPMIEDYHKGFKKTDKHPARDFGDVKVFTNLDPNNEYVVSTRVRCGRSMQGYPFNPCLTEAQYKDMESKVSATLSGLEGELKGKFYPLTGMAKDVQQQLIDDHFLFKEGDRFLQAANACRYWPSGRGIYHNDNKTFLVWCNEEDHLRIISMQMGGDLGQVYARLVTAVNEIEKRVPFSHHDRLGFLTFCPTNLGTTIRASVHIKVPKLAANLAKLEEVAGKYNLQVRGTRGEHTEAEGGIYDISNKRRMGLTEFQAVKEMYDGIKELIKLEKAA